MLRGLFTNPNVRNLLDEAVPAGSTIHAPSGDILPLRQAAGRYADAGESLVLVAGERYGTGSSRDWAAKGAALLGVRAVLAAGFERIHRSNPVNIDRKSVVLGKSVSVRVDPGGRRESKK